ncbi:MAG: amino acid permease [Nanoarchaeota archaeon]
MAELKRNIGIFTIISLTITAMVGSGLFFGVSIGARISGVSSLFAWLLLTLITVYVAACFGELISMFPNAGGVYEFAKQAYGRFPSFLIGWITWIVGNITTGVLIVAAVDYAIPDQTKWMAKIIICIAIILILNIIAYHGIEASAGILLFFAAITLIVISLIVFPGLFHIQTANFHPLIPPNILLVFVTLFFIIETFFGWESASFMAEETINAEKVIPKALIIATIISSVLGLGVAVVTIGILNASQTAASSTSFLDVAQVIYGSLGPTILGIGIVVTLIGSAAGGIISGPRLLLALGRDKLFIEQFSHIHKKFKTPDKAILFQIFVSVFLVFIAFGHYLTMLSYLVPLALLMYITVLFAVVILRFKKKDHHRPFKVPGGKVLPIFVALIYLGIIVSWAVKESSGLHNLEIIGSFLLFGFPIYLLLTFYYNPEFVIMFSNTFAKFNFFFEDILLPKKLRKYILSFFKNLEEKTVLEIGSGVGTLTMHLAEKVGPEGKVIAMDMSEKNLKILRKRIEKRGFKNVELIHDEHMINRIHPNVKKVDMVFSVGHLTYIQDLKKVLKEIYDILPEAGKICFVEYIDFYYFLPNKTLFSNPEELKKVFQEAGFSVNISIKKSLFWKFLFIYGIKTGEGEVPVI